MHRISVGDGNNNYIVNINNKFAALKWLMKFRILEEYGKVVHNFEGKSCAYSPPPLSLCVIAQVGAELSLASSSGKDVCSLDFQHSLARCLLLGKGTWDLFLYGSL